MDPDKFGYLSTHFVVSINDDRARLAEFKRFAGLKAEVQIRTLLQHTWAAIDWKFRYKEEKEAPKPLRRRLFRISALLESADNEFSQVSTELDQIRKSYAESVSAGDLNLPLNTESIVTYLSDSEICREIIKIANSSGIASFPVKDTSVYRRFVITTDYLHLRTVNELDERLRELAPNAKRFFNHLVKAMIKENDRARRLVEPAMLRYLLIGFAPKGRTQLIMRETSVAPGYARAISEFQKAEGK